MKKYIKVIQIKKQQINLEYQRCNVFKKWRPTVYLNGSTIGLGSFDDKKVAIKVLDLANKLKEDGETNVKIYHKIKYLYSSKPLAKNNTSGVAGLGWLKKSNSWNAIIFIKNKPIFLGQFKEKNRAIKTIEKANKLKQQGILDVFKYKEIKLNLDC